MRDNSTASAAVLVAMLILGACGNAPDRNSKSAPSDTATAAGAHAFPTNEISLLWFEQAPDKRRMLFRDLLVSKEKGCDQVSEAILKAGLDGTDLWLVRCTNSADWVVTFTEGSQPEVESCTPSDDICK
jgi:hypothetical protein